MTVELEVWVDDPPKVVLEKRYLDRLRALPIRGVAVMLDGPTPGLADARWTRPQLEELARRLPSHRRTLTAWASADRSALGELGQELPGLLDALGADAIELDVEPAGRWRERSVAGFRDEDGDGKRLDDVAAFLARALVNLPVGEIEVTTFPDALGVVMPLLEQLVARVGHGPKTLRLWLQIYPVATRGEKAIGWNDRLGPVRWPREGLEAARARVPDRVEVCAGLSAYNSVFPGHGESIAVAAEGALLAGSPRLRHWSSKWLCRKGGFERRGRELDKIAQAIAALRPAPPAPAPDILAAAVDGLHRIAETLKDAHPQKAVEVARTADRIAR